MTDVSIVTIADWGKVFHTDYMILMAPGLAFGAVLFFVSRSSSLHFAVLPALLVAVPVLFWVVLVASGSDLEEARRAHTAGWVGAAAPRTVFYRVWNHFTFDKVQNLAVAFLTFY